MCKFDSDDIPSNSVANKRWKERFRTFIDIKQQI